MKKRILLVSMPWARADAPSLQLGILKTCLTQAGIDASALHAAPLLEKRLGADLYWRAANNLHPLLSELCFSLMRREDFQETDLIQLLRSSEEFSEEENTLLIESIHSFCQELRKQAPWKDFDAVGFSCTFNQLQASLWAAEEAKRYGCITLFGGFLAQGDMADALLMNDCVDAVIDGPGEKILAEWVEKGMPHGLHRASCTDITPIVPDYSEWKEARHMEKTSLLFEASRGCEHGLCSFCSQNHDKGRITYPPNHVYACMKYFSENFPACEVELADTSLPFSSLPTLKATQPFHIAGEERQVFAECRCPTPRQMRQLAHAGFSKIQVGVESLHSRVLARMRKGATLLQNICCLRESWNSGLNVFYNIILDMPGTTPQELEETIALLPSLYHLPPPSALVSFQLQRNSFVFQNPHAFGITDIAPHPWHQWLGEGHPLFYFSFRNTAPLPKELLEKAHLAFEKWREAFDADAPLFEVRFHGRNAVVTDSRHGKNERTILPWDEARLLLACRSPQLKSRILALGGNATLLGDLRKRDLLREDHGRFLTLPVIAYGDTPFHPQPEHDALESWFAPDQKVESDLCISI